MQTASPADRPNEGGIKFAAGPNIEILTPNSDTPYAAAILDHQIKKDVDQAKIHLKDHVNTKGQVLELLEDCEYCQIHFEELRILKKWFISCLDYPSILAICALYTKTVDVEYWMIKHILYINYLSLS